MTQKLDVPPRTFFADVFGAVVGDIIPAVHRFDPIPPVPVKPFSPNLLPRFALAVAPQRMNMIAVSTRILFQRVEIRHAPHFRSHEFFVTALRRPNRRFPGERHVRNHLPRCQRVHPITHLDIELRGLEPQIRFDVSCIVHFGLLIADIWTHLSDKDGCVARADARIHDKPSTGPSCVTTIRTTPRAALNPHE